ncbi:wd-repeat protein [Anaeramoeba flamelloides]|uniref:Wd-repeat protein n=1 Tax=Anaeramoeba flamelloides TaxID=1746091 RepID=A0AAV7YG53_9EUKA|nr:wd-repeat protein [Anaeramoeba flamelloides]
MSLGLKFQCSTLDSLKDEESLKFIVGTKSLRESNEVHVLEYEPESNRVKPFSVYSHKNEIWDICSCPWSSSKFFTVYNTGTEFCSTLWSTNQENESENENKNDNLNEKTNLEKEEQDSNEDEDKDEDEDESNNPNNGLKKLYPLVHLPTPEGKISSVLCNTESEIQDRVISFDEKCINVWSLEKLETDKIATNISQARVGRLEKISSGGWNPTDPNLVAIAIESNLSIWDLRDMKKESFVIRQAHEDRLRTIAFNRNSISQVASGGDDCKIKFWDLRKIQRGLENNEEPQDLLTLTGHSHWVWQLEFNPIHDRLLLSSSTDSTVKLWDAPSLAFKDLRLEELESDPDNDFDQDQFEQDIDEYEENKNKKVTTQKDGLLNTFEDHDDSVYSIAWSKTEPWFFASISYDGRFVVNKVPEEIKEKILD